MFLFLCCFSPRLSKLPGWVSKDGTLNLEKVQHTICVTGQVWFSVYVIKVQLYYGLSVT